MTKFTSFSLDILLANCYNNKIIIKCSSASGIMGGARGGGTVPGRHSGKRESCENAAVRKTDDFRGRCPEKICRREEPEGFVPERKFPERFSGFPDGKSGRNPQGKLAEAHPVEGKDGQPLFIKT